MESKPTIIRVKNTVHRIQPIPRKLIRKNTSLDLPQVLNHKGGLIIGEGDTGKTTYVQMLYEAAKAHDKREPILVKLRQRPRLEIPNVPEGEVQTIIWDGLDEYPECARDIRDLTDGLDPARYHVWVTSRPCNAAATASESLLLNQRYYLAPFGNADVRKIARSVDIDGKAFISRVNEAHLESFITKPGGAIILMQLFANGKLKPSDRTDHSMNTAVMETIMHDLARETRDGNDEADPKLPYTEKAIVDATCWIAACLVFSCKDAIWTGEKANCPANDICLDDLPEREYDTDLFQAAIRLRLFEPLSPKRYRLAYSEMPPFLAGRWIARHFPVEKLKELPLFPNLIAPASMSLRAIAWASAYDMAFIEDYFLDYPSYFLRFHARIEKTGFDKFFTALCREIFHRDDDSDDFDDDDPEYRIVESNFAGCTEFAKMLQVALDKDQYGYPEEEYIEACLAACESEPHYSYRLPSLERFDDEEGLFDVPLSPAELDALAPIEQKPVNAVVSEVPEGFVDKIAQAVVEKTKNKGGRPKKMPGKYNTQKIMAEYFGPPCTENDVANWERYVRTDRKQGSPPPTGTYKNRTVIYTADLRKNVEGENIYILAAIVKEYRARHPDNPRPAGVKTNSIKRPETLYRQQHPDGMVRTQNSKGTY